MFRTFLRRLRLPLVLTLSLLLAFCLHVLMGASEFARRPVPVDKAGMMYAPRCDYWNAVCNSTWKVLVCREKPAQPPVLVYPQPANFFEGLKQQTLKSAADTEVAMVKAGIANDASDYWEFLHPVIEDVGVTLYYYSDNK